MRSLWKLRVFFKSFAIFETHTFFEIVWNVECWAITFTCWTSNSDRLIITILEHVICKWRKVHFYFFYLCYFFHLIIEIIEGGLLEQCYTLLKLAQIQWFFFIFNFLYLKLKNEVLSISIKRLLLLPNTVTVSSKYLIILILNQDHCIFMLFQTLVEIVHARTIMLNTK